MLIGSRSGIVKIIPPESWTAKQRETPLKEHLSEISIKSSIRQEISSNGGMVPGTYRQVNFENSKTYSVENWFNKCKEEGQVDRPHPSVLGLDNHFVDVSIKNDEDNEKDTEIEKIDLSSLSPTTKKLIQKKKDSV